jgi:hypothetical protein
MVSFSVAEHVASVVVPDALQFRRRHFHNFGGHVTPPENRANILRHRREDCTLLIHSVVVQFVQTAPLPDLQ